MKSLLARAIPAILLAGALVAFAPREDPVMWFVSVPKLDQHFSFKGRFGWHQSIWYGRVETSVNQVGDAIEVCRKHGWKGYVHYRDMVADNIDSCEFMKTVELPPIPARLQTIPERVVSIAMEVGVPPALATQLASVESGMNPEARHYDRNGTSWGVMMLNDRFQPMVHGDANIRVGLRYLRAQLDKCAGDWACGVARYQGRY